MLCHHAVANVYDEEEIWSVVEKKTPPAHAIHTYFKTGKTFKQARNSDCDEQDCEVLLQRSTRVQSPGDETIAF